MILQVTLKTAELIGETPVEWELLEKQARGQGSGRQAPALTEPV